MRFFFDRCISIRIARMVSGFESNHTVRHHDDDTRFGPTTQDTEWIEALANDGLSWIIVSGDGRILKNKVERAALEQTQLPFFCMAKAWMNMKIHEYAWKFMKVWPEIVEHAEHSKARVFEVGGGKSLLVTPLA